MKTTTPRRVLDDLEAAFAREDVEGIVALFTEDATLESYLVCRVFDRPEGVCRGHAELRELVVTLMKRGTPWGGHSRRSWTATRSPSSATAVKALAGEATGASALPRPGQT